MTLPPFPFWMTMAGAPDLEVQDINGYNAALAMGYTLPTTAPVDPTPSGAPTIEEEPLDSQQPNLNDPAPLP